MSKDHLSDSDDDMYGDLPSPKPSTSGAASRGNFYIDVSPEAPTMPEIICIDDEDEKTMPFLSKSNLEPSEMNLYTELLKSDSNKRKEKMLFVSDYKRLKEQNLELQKLVAQKDAKLAALTLQEATVRKNITSLYKTAKNEIDQKDRLLKEANEKLDRYYVLDRRKISNDNLETQSPQTSNVKPNDYSKGKSNEVREGRIENSKERSSGFNDQNGRHSHDKEKIKEKSSSKRKRSRSPSNDSRKPKNGANRYLDNKQYRGSTDIRNTTRPTIKENSGSKQNLGLNDAHNTTHLAIKENFGSRQNHDSNNTKPSTQVSNNVNSDQKQSVNSNSDHNAVHSSDIEIIEEMQNSNLNSSQLVVEDHEPSIAEVFSQMQELAFRDPSVTNAIFANLLPTELRQSFSEFEVAQTDGLNKLKLSFVSYYFAQCSGGDSVSSQNPTPKDSGNADSEAHSSNAFFFQQNASDSRSEKEEGPQVSNESSAPESINPGQTLGEESEEKSTSVVQKLEENASDSRIKTKDGLQVSNESSASESSIKPGQTLGGESEGKSSSVVQKSERKLQKCKKKYIPNLHKSRNANLTLYSQRCLRKNS